MTKKLPLFYTDCLYCEEQLPEDRSRSMKYCCNWCARQYRKLHCDRYMNEAKYINSDIKHFLQRLRNKRSGKRKGLSVEFLHSLWNKQQGKCAITGDSMTHIAGNGRLGSNISIDQILSSKGYTEGNVQLVTWDANRIKGSLSMNQLYDLCRRILDAK